MVLSLNVILFLTLHLLPGMKSSMVNLINNGYEGIVIAINPSVPEDEKLIENIKEMVTEASTYLFHATKRRVYFRNVRILIPMTWKSKSEYFIPKQESYDQADVIVANPYLIYGDDPYTLQYGRCGEKGKYIHFTPNFMLTNNFRIYGSRGRVFVHEWAHLRWGIFDEYNMDRPFYIARKNTIEATRCSTHITGTVVFKKCQGGSCITRPCRRDSQTGLYEAKCTFIPEKSQTAKESIMFMQSLHSAIIHSNQSTSGSEIILLTDGEDNEINLCFEDVKQSGAIIHTIALGPSAAKELETLSNMTGGYRFFANKDINGLTNAFSRISSRSGSITQQAIQLESKALKITGRKRVNGTVPIDSTIGNDTFFVVTWTIQKPEILLQDPKGKKYKTLDFKEDKLNIRSARLRIPGIAETGTWTYSLLNNHASSQMLTVTVTTRARSPTTPPVIATAHMSQNTAHYPSPVIVYAQVSQGFLPVLGISVIAIIETEDGHQVTLELWDNGAGKIILNPPRPEVKDDLAKVKIEDFSRLTSGGSFTVSGAPPPPGNHPSVLPPSKITDLEAKFKEDYIQLSWTAPGNVLDKGKASGSFPMSQFEMVTEASTYLFHATKRRVYFRNVSILIPMTWKSKSEYLMPKQESYDQAEVIVANPYLKHGDDPYTLQYGRCGEKGQYIHFTPDFLLNNNLPIYGSRGRAFVHEWAHLRWGVFDEYNGDQPFYISRRNTIEATRCSTHITGTVVFKKCQGGSCITRPCRRDSQTGLYEAKCTFIPEKSQTAKESIMFMQSLHSAIIQSHQSTSGSEIILLTDGEDNEIHLCIEEVKQSGVIIHTIALGPSAAKELETLSDMTGGNRFYANKDINGLTNAFSRISSRSGSITQQTIQLESKALAIIGKKWVNGTVPVDSTIGNDTFFVVTWTIQKPEILLQDPKGKKYKTSDFKEDKLNIHSARLRIPGIAETGTWTYSLLNNHASSQMLTVTVTTRARSPTTPPVTAIAHMSQNTAHYPSPVIVYAQVSQGFLPVLGINVTAIIETEDGHQVTLELWDNGAGKIILNPPRPEVKDDLAKVEIEDFNRLTSGGSFTVSGAPPPGNHPSVLPPNKIIDLEAKFKEYHIQLSWTAPGNVLDKGKANSYIIRISKSFVDLQEDFDNATLVNTSSLKPKEAGSVENFEFKPEPFRIENGTNFYIAIQAINEANLISEVSNIAQAIKFIPMPEDSVHALGTKISAISLAIFGLAMILSIF
ncbi:hypothetical protein G4228_013559 [Cervus hanglu yarkandensis]|nr:hypothetical protein G4228_013559 [Cervus hanglu yarkandensis]